MGQVMATCGFAQSHLLEAIATEVMARPKLEARGVANLA